MMKKAVLGYYSDAEISQAKETMWNCYGEDLLGKKQKRNSAGEKAIREKEVDDVVEAMSLVDCNHGEWDKVTFCAVNWRCILRSSLEELSMMSLLDRLASVEVKLNRICDTSSSHTAQLAGVISDVSEMKKKDHFPSLNLAASFSSKVAAGKTSRAPVVTQSVNGLDGLGSKPAVKGSDSAPSVNSGKVISHNDPTSERQGNIPKAVGSQEAQGGAKRRTHNWFDKKPEQSHTTEEVKKMCDDLPPGFRYPPSFAKKLHVVGKKKSQDNKISGAPNQRIMFVENVCKTTNDEDMKEYVSAIVPIEEFQCASVDQASRKSFKFKVRVGDASKLLDPEIWPEGIGCRLWQFRPKKINQDNNIQQQ